MSMLFKVDIKQYSLSELQSLLEKYPFSIGDGSDLKVVYSPVSVYGETQDKEYPFVDSQYGVLITDFEDKYRGLTSEYGRASIFWSESDEDAYGCLKATVLRLRIAHEVLHHFAKPCHDIEKWLEDKPFFKMLWRISGSGSRVNLGMCLCQDMFYDYLFEGLDEEQFNKDNLMEYRTSSGMLIAH